MADWNEAYSIIIAPTQDPQALRWRHSADALLYISQESPPAPDDEDAIAAKRKEILDILPASVESMREGSHALKAFLIDACDKLSAAKEQREGIARYAELLSSAVKQVSISSQDETAANLNDALAAHIQSLRAREKVFVDDVAQARVMLHAAAGLASEFRVSGVDVGCPVCMERAVSFALVPCGHMLCERCAKILATPRSKCCKCNTPLSSYLRLYF